MQTLLIISLYRFRGHRLLRRMAETSLTLAAMTLFAGCTPTPERSVPMVDQTVDFSDYETFGWYSRPGADGSAPLSLADSAIRDAISAEMRRRGYVKAPAGSTADFLIDYQAARTEKVKSNPVRIGIGVGSYGSRGGASIGTSTPGARNVSEGSLVIHAIDPARNTEVWRSGISRELPKGNVEPKVMKSIVAEILGEFPTRTPVQE